MKKLLVWCLVLTMVISTVVFPISAFATETTEDTTTGDTTTEGTETDTETETTTSPEVIHFNYTFDDYATSGTLAFPNSASNNVTGGSWNTIMKSAGNIVQGVDGNAFHFTKDASSGMYASYNPTADVTSGKWLWSFDMAYNTAGTKSRVTWMMNNSTPEYVYFLALQYPNSTTVGSVTAAYTQANGKVLNQGNLFKATDSEKEYTVDILLDFDENLATYYVNGQQKTSNKMSMNASTTFKGTTFKLNLNNNINKLDNFKLVENPSSKFSFAQKGEVTSESEYVTVRFSDTVVPSAEDFIIANTEGTQVATVTEVEQVNGKFYNLKLSNKLEPGNYNLTLADTTLTSVVAGKTSKNTTSAFTVLPEYTYFDMDFENFTNITDYLTGYTSLGTWTWPSGGNCNAVSSNTYQFAGDSTKGIAGTGIDLTKKWQYTLNEPVTSGVLKISFDAAFDTAKKTKRSQFVYINNDTTNGCVMNYGKTADNGGLKYIVSGGEDLVVFDGNKSVAIEDNEPHRWEIIIDMDNTTLENYCDGKQFSSVNFGTTQTQITDVSIMLLSAVSFFDNYKVTLNVDDFGYTASDIGTYSNSTIINFDDTMVFDDVSTAMVFADPYGNIVTPTSVTKISPRKYKADFSAVDLIAGEYKVTLADGITTSAIGNTPKIESASFTVAERPEDTFFAKNLDFAEVEGGVSLSTTLTNWGEDTENPEEALLVIAVYDGNELVECVADSFDIASGDTDIEKSITLTTAKDLSQYTVRGFVWDIGEEFYSLYEPATATK